MTGPILQAESITKGHGHRTLWRDVDLAVSPGAALVVTGPSGSGKSTLLRCLGLVERVDSGTVVIADEDVTRVRAGRRSALYRHTIGHLFQNGALEDDWTVRRNLDVAFIGATTKRSMRVPIRQAALTSVGLHIDERTKAHRLSGGERHRLALARLVIRRPAVVLADEPTAALDVATGAEVLECLAGLRAQGSAIVIATHDPAVVVWADDVLVLSGEQGSETVRTSRRRRWERMSVN